LHDVLKNSVEILSKKKMLSKSDDILEKLEEIIDHKEGVTRAKVTSKNKLHKDEIKEIEEILKKKYKAKDIYLDIQEDKKLIGGVKIEVGDEIIDFSLRNGIDQLQIYLTNN
jgi:F-type H+-transporting ATPase subunit delta